LDLVKIGRYKVTWWASGQLESKMFSSQDAALRFAGRLTSSFLVMESVHVGDGAYRWRVLPFGAHRALGVGRVLYENRVLILLVLLAVGLHIAAERNPNIRNIL
jgi:hypothetical protein